MDQLLRFALNAFRHFIQDIGGLMDQQRCWAFLYLLIQNFRL